MIALQGWKIDSAGLEQEHKRGEKSYCEKNPKTNGSLIYPTRSVSWLENILPVSLNSTNFVLAAPVTTNSR